MLPSSVHAGSLSHFHDLMEDLNHKRAIVNVSSNTCYDKLKCLLWKGF